MTLREPLFVTLIFLGACGSGPTSPGTLTEGSILSRLGALGRGGLPPEQIEAYTTTFGFLDEDGNGLISVEEYEENSIFSNPGSARGVFGATDRDGSGGVTVEEYVANRIITDEAKEILVSLDLNGDIFLTRDEMRTGTDFTEGEIIEIFGHFDRDGDGGITQIEWLITWGNWARLPGVDLANT